MSQHHEKEEKKLSSLDSVFDKIWNSQPKQQINRHQKSSFEQKRPQNPKNYTRRKTYISNSKKIEKSTFQSMSKVVQYPVPVISIKRNEISQFNQINSPIYWQTLANKLKSQHKFTQAIDKYQIAISLNDKYQYLYLNKAKCFKCLQKLDDAIEQCNKAIKFDGNNIQAYLVLGKILCEFGKHRIQNSQIQVALQNLNKASNLCLSLNKKQLKHQINQTLGRCKKLLWYKNYQQSQRKKLDSVSNFQKSIKLMNDIDNEQKQKLLEQFKNSLKPSCDFKIPQHMCCKITYQIMTNPVITSSGHTYERSIIEDHILKNGNFDPLTREDISNTLYPNLIMKSIISDFYQSNPWAYEIDQKDYRKFDFTIK